MKTKRIFLKRIDSESISSDFKDRSDFSLLNSNYSKSQNIPSYNSLDITKGINDNKKNRWWEIQRINDERILGYVGLNNLKEDFKQAELGFWLDQENWGRGIMSEAVKLVVNHGLVDLGLVRINSFVDRDNTQCINTLKELNFSFERSINDCISDDGQLQEVDIYSIKR